MALRCQTTVAIATDGSTPRRTTRPSSRRSNPRSVALRVSSRSALRWGVGRSASATRRSASSAGGAAIATALPSTSTVSGAHVVLVVRGDGAVKAHSAAAPTKATTHGHQRHAGARGQGAGREAQRHEPRLGRGAGERGPLAGPTPVDELVVDVAPVALEERPAGSAAPHDRDGGVGDGHGHEQQRPGRRRHAVVGRRGEREQQGQPRAHEVAAGVAEVDAGRRAVPHQEAQQCAGQPERGDPGVAVEHDREPERAQAPPPTWRGRRGRRAGSPRSAGPRPPARSPPPPPARGCRAGRRPPCRRWRPHRPAGAAVTRRPRRRPARAAGPARAGRAGRAVPRPPARPARRTRRPRRGRGPAAAAPSAAPDGRPRRRVAPAAPRPASTRSVTAAATIRATRAPPAAPRRGPRCGSGAGSRPARTSPAPRRCPRR